MIELAVIENNVILSLLRRPDALNKLPFLNSYAAKLSATKGKCTPCARRKAENSIDYNAIKQTFGSMSVENKVELKKLLGAKQVRLYYTNEKGQRVKMTF